MQDPSLYSQINAQVQHPQTGAQFPEQEHLKCPRCDSANTKFCYYNNYNLSQPRHFCKSCRRYWTKGGTLRNIPVGGGSRKNAKRSSSSSTSSTAAADSSSAASKRPASAPPASVKNKTSDSKGCEGKVTDEMPLKGDNFEGQFGSFLGASGSFSSLLGSTEGQFSNFLDGPSGLQMGGDHFCDPGSGQNMDPHGLESGSSNNADGFLNIPGEDAGGGWSGGSNGWPDLSMYTPGSNFL